MEVETPKRNWGKSTKIFQTTAFSQLNPFFCIPIHWLCYLKHVDKRMSTFPKRLQSLDDESAEDLPDSSSLKDWTVDNVATWLKSVDLADLVPLFRGIIIPHFVFLFFVDILAFFFFCTENQVSGVVLQTFDKDEAKKINVSIGKRLVLLKRIQLLREESEEDKTGSQEPEDDDDFLPSSPGNDLNNHSLLGKELGSLTTTFCRESKGVCVAEV